jgi:hypothetical protein
MERLVLELLAILFVLLVLSSIPLAQHQHEASKSEAMKSDTREVLVEGAKAIFQIMPNEEHRKMLKDMKMKEELEPGTTHNIAVVLVDEKTQKEIMEAQVKMKVIDPAGKDQIKTLKAEEMMKSYDGYFNLPGKGKYQLLISFRVGEKRRNAGIFCDLN